jgi:Holliday junction resolvase
MSNVQKGYKKEKLIRDELKKDGWKIVFKSVRWRFGTIDFAGLFDVVAYKGQERLYISSKHLGDFNYYLPHQEEIKKFAEEHGKQGERYELWLWDKPRWKGRGKNKIWNPGGFIKVKIWQIMPVIQTTKML